MRVLVAGGQRAAFREVVERLVEDGHQLRLVVSGGEMPRHMRGVEMSMAEAGKPWPAPGAAAGCDALVVLHEDDEHRVRALLGEAERSGVSRLLLVVPLASPRGGTVETVVRGASPAVAWTILRTTHTYGPGDPLFGSLVTMVRTLPMLPVPIGGDRRQQPLAARDLAESVVRTLERDDLAERELELAGMEETSLTDVLDRIERITGRSPPRLPVPDELLSAGMQLASSFGMDAAAAENPLTALAGENALPVGTPNALTTVLGVEPTPLDEGLRLLADSMPEQLPDQGVGPLMRRRWWADIQNSRLSPPLLFAWFRGHFADCLELAGLDAVAEPEHDTTIDPGALLTFDLPLRGRVQLRVADVLERSATLVTVQGHPLRAAITFEASDYGSAVRFEITSVERAASSLDALALTAGGSMVLELAMERVVECVVRASDGSVIDGVRTDEQELDGDAAAREEARIAGLVSAAWDE